MNNESAPQQATAPLTAEQWAGLARLGDLGNRLGALVDGPLGGPATATLERIGEIDSRHDLAALTEKFIDTLGALESAGLLDLVRDNAQFFADSLEVIGPMASQWMEHVRELPAEELKADINFALGLLRKSRMIADFVDDKLAGELVGKTVEVTAFIERNQADKALAEALVQLSRLYRNGTLARLGNLSDYLAGLDEGSALESQLGSLVRAVPGDSIVNALKLLRAADRTLAELASEGDDSQLGGYRGLLRILRDKNVQKGLRVFSKLPGMIEQDGDAGR